MSNLGTIDYAGSTWVVDSFVGHNDDAEVVITASRDQTPPFVIATWLAHGDDSDASCDEAAMDHYLEAGDLISCLRRNGYVIVSCRRSS